MIANGANIDDLFGAGHGLGSEGRSRGRHRILFLAVAGAEHDATICAAKITRADALHIRVSDENWHGWL